MMEKATGAWFRPKRYGWGASPANWKGWLATAVFMALAVAITQVAALPFNIAALAALTVVFIWIVWKKTDGSWRWRWGPDDE